MSTPLPKRIFDYFSHRAFLLLGIFFLIVSISLTAHAIITVSNGGLSGDTNVTVDTPGTLNLGTASSTAIIIGKPGIPVTIPGNLTVNGTLSLGAASSTGQLLFKNASTSFSTLLQASSSQVSNLTFTLPNNTGTPGQALVTDGAGNLSFSTITGNSTSSSQWLTDANGSISFSGGNVTVGTTLPGTYPPGSLGIGGLLSQPFDWYIDSVNGSDSNDGKTQWTPFKTIARLTSTTQFGWSGDLTNGVWSAQSAASKQTAQQITFGLSPLSKVVQGVGGVAGTYTIAFQAKMVSGTGLVRAVFIDGITDAFGPDIHLNANTWTTITLTRTAAGVFNSAGFANGSDGLSRIVMIRNPAMAAGTLVPPFILTFTPGTLPISGSIVQAGQRVGLAAGSNFLEMLSTNQANITVGMYGVGPRPKLTAFDPVLASSWAATAGQANVYQITVSTPLQASGNWVSAMLGGARAVRATSLVNCQRRRRLTSPVPTAFRPTLSTCILPQTRIPDQSPMDMYRLRLGRRA